MTLVAWAYISFLCYNWGQMFLKLLTRLFTSGTQVRLDFSIVCLIGLAVIGTVAQCFSLITGLGTAVIQLVFLLPALLSFLLSGYGNRVRNSALYLRTTHPAILLLLSSVVLVILIMSVYPISHPDTLAYHAQLTMWAEQYPVVPGLVNIDYHYGFQSSWFLLCALFSFSFTGNNALTFINTTIILWWVIFIGQKIHRAMKLANTPVDALFWFALLVINMVTYTHIRLTVTSLSPDFIVAIYILLPVYLAITDESAISKLLTAFLCFFAVTLKLIAIPIALLGCYCLFTSNFRTTIYFLIVSAVVIIPFIIRNVITTGHLLFPSSFADIIQVDWKYPTKNLSAINEYIRSYAVTHDSTFPPGKIASMPLAVWLKTWWAQLYLTDKILLAAAALSALILPVRYKRFLSLRSITKTCVLVSIAGCIFWFIEAPDPRFGIGFLLLLPALVLHELVRKNPGKGGLVMLCTIMTIIVSSYAVYRLKNYFRAQEFIAPDGIIVPDYSVYHKQIETSIPLISTDDRGTLTAPAKNDQRAFDFRGKSIQEGFRPRAQKDAQ